MNDARSKIGKHFPVYDLVDLSQRKHNHCLCFKYHATKWAALTDNEKMSKGIFSTDLGAQSPVLLPDKTNEKLKVGKFNTQTT